MFGIDAVLVRVQHDILGPDQLVARTSTSVDNHKIVLSQSIVLTSTPAWVRAGLRAAAAVA